MKKDKGQTAVLLIILIPIILVILAYTLSNGKLIYERIKLQNATDGAAYTSALWSARGLNVISDLNWSLILVEGAETAKLRFDYKASKVIMKAQDTVNITFPGTGALAGMMNFKANMKEEGTSVMPAGLKGMFSLRVTRYSDEVIPMWMVKDLATGWGDQRKRGPYSRIAGQRLESGGVFNVSLLGFNIPSIYSVAQAMPYRENDELTQDEISACLFDSGGLWSPEFYPKLVPVTFEMNIPILNKAMLH